MLTRGGQVLLCGKGLVVGDVVTGINRYLLGFLVSPNTSNLNDTRYLFPVFCGFEASCGYLEDFGRPLKYESVPFIDSGGASKASSGA